MQRNCTVLAFVYWLFFQKLLLTVGSEYGCRTFAVASVIINADWLCKDDESGAKMHPGTGSVTPPWPANDTKMFCFQWLQDWSLHHASCFRGARRHRWRGRRGGPAPNTAWVLGVRFPGPLGPRRGKAARTNKHRGGVARPSFRATHGPVGL